ncbi:MAG TPA: SAM-dependent chlorinase/fluorinase [Solirubrobacterales bacterium]|nr:SAM-dependent chlorinase/fluorinase [Solirubrobacterales bacterium]
MLPLSFLSDYGHGDEFVGVCHGVVQRIAPGAVVIDVTHDIPRHDVRLGALSLQRAVPYLPQGVHIAVVDPGVGGERRAVAIRAADGNMFVGPDNGLLWPAAETCGGVVEAVDVGQSPHRLEPVSATFHGRDLFAPVAAHLALGAALGEAGRAMDPGTLHRLELPPPELSDGRIRTRVVAVDRFGNLELNVRSADMREAGFEIGDCLEVLSSRRTGSAVYARTFSDVGEREAVILEDSSGRIAVAVNQGSATGALGVGAEAELLLQPCDDH